MFTGIVEETGTVFGVLQTERDYQMTFNASVVLGDTKIGDSISVNGVCLTVTRFDDKTFTVGVAPETRKRTNLATLQKGARVNLERACTPSTRLGGHYVQGHVDGTGVLVEKRPDGEALWLTLQCDPSIMRYVVPKGYICMDGVSLTVVDVWPDRFNIMLIQHTQSVVTLPARQTGDKINIEVDILGKYVEKFLAGDRNQQTPINSQFLGENGFT